VLLLKKKKGILLYVKDDDQMKQLITVKRIRNVSITEPPKFINISYV
jgi:hypothetical protein